MFTGIIEEIGVIERVAPGKEGGKTLAIKSSYDPKSLAIGESIATSGVCLTVTKIEGSRFFVDAGPETLARTTIGELAVGSRVNLERSVTLATRLGGHLVQGHVDAVGLIIKIEKRENAYDLDIKTPPEVLRLSVPRGSITVDGISLTITQRTQETLSVSIIPHTWQVTTIAERKVNDHVNLEADLIARYVKGLLDATDTKPGGGGLTEAFLKENGF